MKWFFSTLILSVFSFAQAQTCFQLNAQPETRVPSYLPQVVCLENLSIHPLSGFVQFKLADGQALTSQLSVRSFVRHNESKAKFMADGELYPKWEDSACFVNQSVVFHIEGIQDVSASTEFDPQQLKLSATYHGLADVCHDLTFEEQASYTLLP
jgi:hypothetical protein